MNGKTCIVTVTLNTEKTKIIRDTNYKCMINQNKIQITGLFYANIQEVCGNLNPIQQIFEDMSTKFLERTPNVSANQLPTFTSMKSSLLLDMEKIFKIR